MDVLSHLQKTEIQISFKILLLCGYFIFSFSGTNCVNIASLTLYVSFQYKWHLCDFRQNTSASCNLPDGSIPSSGKKNLFIARFSCHGIVSMAKQTK